MLHFIPNIITFFRLLLTVPVSISIYNGNEGLALILFIFAGLSDGFDGYLARKFRWESKLGKILDPLADKVMILSALISFAVMNVIPFWMVAIIIFRDVFVTGLRTVMSSKNMVMVTSNIAKRKTLTQVLIIIFILLHLGSVSFPISWIGDFHQFSRHYQLIYYLTLSVTIFTLLTGFTYLYTNRAVIRQYIS